MRDSHPCHPHSVLTYLLIGTISGRSSIIVKCIETAHPRVIALHGGFATLGWTPRWIAHWRRGRLEPSAFNLLLMLLEMHQLINNELLGIGCVRLT